MSDAARATALDRLNALRECLQQEPDLSGYVEQTEQLITAVRSSHLEAIRFRLFGLRRQLTSHDPPPPEAVTGLLETVGAALRDAGFKI